MNQPPPLVTVICLCYNQAPFVLEALQSVAQQSYPAWQLIVVDDASQDNSLAIIRQWIAQHPASTLLALDKNQGNCRAFNRALTLARGKYVIDLAADDVLLPERLARQVAFFEQLPPHYGVIFGDAAYIDVAGKNIGPHYRRNAAGELLLPPPQGDVYRQVLSRSFSICTPSLMMRRSLLEQLGGYDETLSYEDYDFCLRAARQSHFAYQDEVLTLKRVVSGSHGEGFYLRRHNPHLASTLRICHKARQLNRDPGEDRALAATVRYHLRLSVYTENFALAREFASLLGQLVPLRWHDRLLMALAAVHFPLFPFYRLYFRLRYRFHR